jgi:hypothetical protein
MPKEIPLRIPDPIQDVDSWAILGLDPSLRRTGYSLMRVTQAQADWVKAGSLKPDDITNGLHPDRSIWIRTKIQALYLRRMMEAQTLVWQAEGVDTKKMGLIISLEAPPPQNDYLASIHRAVHTVLFETTFLADNYNQIRILYINPSTLRSLMHLTQRGNKNKGENIACAYTFIDKEEYPELDTDSCDAVLTAMVARNVVSILMGRPGQVQQNFLNSLCNSTLEVKGRGTRTRTVTKGILHRSEYWYMYKPEKYNVAIKDATVPKKTLRRVEFSI